jgi:hemolysin III
MLRSKNEEKLNTLTHFVWLIFSLIFFIISLFFNYYNLVIYFLGSFIAAFGSTIYHACDINNLNLKNKLRKIDKYCIFIFMGFTVLSFGIGQSLFWFTVFVFVLALILAHLYLFDYIKENKSEKYYLYFTIIAAFSAQHLFIPWLGFNKTILFFILGLIFYLIGYLFYLLDGKFKWMHTLWHLFVIAAWIFHIMALINI